MLTMLRVILNAESTCQAAVIRLITAHLENELFDKMLPGLSRERKNFIGVLLVAMRSRRRCAPLADNVPSVTKLR